MADPGDGVYLILVLVGSVCGCAFPRLFLCSFRSGRSRFGLIPAIVVSRVRDSQVNLFHRVSISCVCSIFERFFILLDESPSKRLLLTLPGLRINAVQFLRVICRRFVFSFKRVIRRSTRCSSVLNNRASSALVYCLSASAGARLRRLERVGVFYQLVCDTWFDDEFFSTLR